ncbi:MULTISPECIES: D-alanyl-D-alanine carboxypeptidase [Bradyrhizobium]|jgi:D-alanyl-D-alanine carboxypeptidase|uniref:D-alanyl-D-alanine carboxypeptidase n=2 Tax=Bradyrhizobium TaxID=374 RepID=A0ABY0QDZ9_9BRAD|nr:MULTISPECIES: D-alanyl-D-alanine carboxypeptidase [Bradyrhizobium]SDK01270.1 D-alanyl-D-alanine carboxypeptidase [Bradyrhizobium ottawaense]SEB89179.1 D-alanyl-D-alanine carboxypeptidase [Bradyrhizobium lablabi]SHM61116.1 D-alanyl-D-alanine carboxypeptidase [Bradyrhizobium lablabi]
MLRTTLASSRTLRVCVLGLATFTTAILITSDSAEARRYRHRHVASHHRTHVASESYSPQFSSIIVDGNSGAVLTSNNPDGSRHPASLTKIMTLYLLFERLESKKMNLDTEMDVSEHASDQAPTKLGLRPGQTIRVEDAIKGLVTRSANDAAVVIAEAIGGDEDDFAKMMTRKARALGMTKTTYRNASGLPNDEQVTTARDQATLGRAIQDRFPTYYRYFSTSVFNYRGQSIRNHNHLLGNVEGVDGIKTGYTRASGFNLVTSMRRGNRHLVGVVLGGRSGGSRDAIMRNLLAENLEKGATRRTVAAITERNPADANADVAEAESASRSTETVQVNSAVAAAEPGMAAQAAMRPVAPAKPSLMAAAAAALPPPPARAEPQAKPEPAQFTSGVIQTQQIAAIPGSAEPMKPVKVKTVQVKAGSMRLASAGSSQPTPITSTIPTRPEVAETSSAVVAKATETNKTDMARVEMPPQPANHGTGQGLLGVLPASSMAAAPSQAASSKAGSSQASSSQALAYADPAPRTVQENGAIKPAVARSGWIIQVGALESEGEAKQRIDLARSKASSLLSKADPFTEPVVAKDNRKLYRARFAGLERDQAEAVCKTLKRADISCITVRN